VRGKPWEEHAMRMNRASALALMTLAFAACGGDESGNYATREESEPAESEEEEEAPAAAPAAHAVVEPLSFKVLLPYLPPAAAGWTAGEPNGQTTSMPEYKVTIVSNQYRGPAPSDGTAEPTMNVEITDGGFAEMVSAPFTMMSQFSNETTTGYQKGVTIDGQPGYETWDSTSRRSDLTLLVGQRFLVHLAGYQVEPEALHEWLGSMNLAQLADEG
jgi:hypothetical protein